MKKILENQGCEEEFEEEFFINGVKVEAEDEDGTDTDGSADHVHAG